MDRAGNIIPQGEAASHFFGTGLQYYTAGRFSAFAGFIPVTGNLLHHAVEMMLKGHLSRKLTLAELKRLSHSLAGVWAMFKQDIGASDLDELNPVVEALNRFEAIRYPDRIVSEGMFGSISISGPPASMKNTEPQPAYPLVLEDVDRLVKIIFDKSQVNPKFFSGLIRAEGSAFLKKDNKSPLNI